jgi:crotonobetainyl-CoA:carnitine CoA-transferase CaiB-like acyl-CoA transferase
VKKNNAKEGLLAKLRVLDIADEKASFCSKILADLGAQVIKVEKPGGDSSRKIGPFLNNSAHPEQSLFFWYNNTNKVGVTLDLQQIDGRKFFAKLIEKADVVVESYAPGYLSKLGLSFEFLSAVNPALIMVSVTGFGQDGPRKDFRSCDLVASALGGQMYVCGSPSLFPIKAYGQQSYLTASLYAAVGILMALRKRASTGKGDHIDISLQETVASTLEHVMVRYFQEGAVAKRRGDRHWSDFFCILPCKDGFIHLTPFFGWETLVELLDRAGKAEDLKDKKWNDEGYRVANIDHAVDVLQKWTKIQAAGELFKLGQLMRLPWAPIHSPNEIMASPQLKVREFFMDFFHPELSTAIPYPKLPYRYSSPCATPKKRAPLIGEDNANVLPSDFEFKEIKAKKNSIHKQNPSDVHNKKDYPLGFRVLDFTRVLAGPYATRILGDFGAEVIKVQSKKTATGAEDNTGFYFNTWNRNKRSITLDMSRPEARKIALKLTAISDVLVENFSPRVMSNWGLNYEKLKEAKKDLIMVSMSGMGQTGPWKDYVAFGPTLQSLGGLTYLTSYSKDAPVGLGYSYADAVAGLYCAIGVLAALEHRDRTGLGQRIDLSEYEAVCTLIGPALLDAAANQKVIETLGNQSPHISAAPYGCYKCLGEDRWCVVAVFDEAEWHKLCNVTGNREWAKDPRFSNFAMRKEHAEVLDVLIQQWTSKNTAEMVMKLLQEAGVHAGVVQNAQDLMNDPQLQARGFFVKLDHPVLGKIVSDGSPIKIGSNGMPAWKSAPLLGEDNEYVYLELLGLAESEFKSYIERGIIA